MNKLLLSAISNPADEIIPSLWLGSVNSLDFGFISKQGINTVINMTPDLANIIPNTHRYPLKDTYSENPKMVKYIPKATRKIHTELLKGNTVLVHCLAGAQRSATIVVAYLVRYHNMTVNNAIKYVREKRAIALFPHMTFKPALLLIK